MEKEYQEVETMKAIGERIRQTRMNCGMTQAELADKAAISVPHLSDIERGRKQARLTTFIRIAEAMQVSTDAILRPDIPEVRRIYAEDFYKLLSDCTPAEQASLIEVARVVKAAFRKH